MLREALRWSVPACRVKIIEAVLRVNTPTAIPYGTQYLSALSDGLQYCHAVGK